MSARFAWAGARTACAALAIVAVFARAQENDPAIFPEGEELLAQVRAALPDAPMRVTAQLQPRGAAKGKTVHAEMFLDWNAPTPQARYTIRDAFGATLEAMQVLRPPGGDAEYLYYQGNPLTGSPQPNLYLPVQETDITWIDLSLSFLWWPYGQTLNSEKVRGRNCYVVEVPAPFRASNSYSRARLWIDAQAHVMLQASALDDDNREIKRLQVKSFKKINKVWMIRDLEVQSFPSKHRTLLRVRNVEMLEDARRTGEPDSEEEAGEEMLEPVSDPPGP